MSDTPATTTTTETSDMLTEVLQGLTRDQKVISPKFFYDERGSELFEEITRLEEYYPTRTERALLSEYMPAWVGTERPEELVELGAGNSEKSRVILSEMLRHIDSPTYVPVDVSGDFLERSAAELRREFPALEVVPTVADISHPLDVDIATRKPTWFALLGSTIGNFDDTAARELLRSIRRRLAPGDRFLMGADLRPGPHKSKARLEAAYNDALGVTADFNRNVLHVLNRELGADFDVDQFEHLAFYDEEQGRIEMHLRAMSAQSVSFPDAAPVVFDAGETVRTEISCKYDRACIDALFSDSGLRVERWVEDPEGLFALILAGPS